MIPHTPNNDRAARALDEAQTVVARGPNGNPLPLYKLDLLDRVIFMPDPFSPARVNGWPDGARLADFELRRDDPDAPFEGRTNRHAFMGYVRQLFTISSTVTPHLTEDSIVHCYPGGRLQKVDTIFFPAVCARQDDSEILAVIRAIDSAKPDDASVAEAMSVLNSLGVFRIPALPKFSRRYHEASGQSVDGAEIKTIVRDGWVRDGRVLVKSVVETI